MAALQGNLFDMLGISKQSWRAWKEVSLLSALFMELSWISPWLHVFLQGEEPESQLAVVKSLAFLGLLSFILMRLSVALGLKRNVRLLVLLGLLILLLPNSMALILSTEEKLGYFSVLSRVAAATRSAENLIPNEFLVYLGIVFVWIRAVRWASADGRPSEMQGRFKFGFIMLVIYVLTFTRMGQGNLSYFLYTFFFFAWMAMGSSRLARAEVHAAAGRDFFSFNWLLIVFIGFLLGALALATLGLGINARFALVQQTALSIWLLLWGLIILLLSPIIIVISWVFQFLSASFLPTNVGDSIQESIEDLANVAPPTFLQTLIDWLNSLRIADWLIAMQPFFLWGIIGLSLFAGLYYVGRRTSFWKAVADLDIQTERGDDWWLSLADARRNRIGELRNSLAHFTDLNVGKRLFAATRIRRVYSFLMDLSAELGQARKDAQTPLEYIPSLNKVFPHHSGDVNTISRAYMRVRYGELDETPSDVIKVDRAWLQLRLEGERIKKKRRKKMLKDEKGES